MFDYAIFEKAHCNKEERRSCLRTIECILSLHKLMQEFGVLALEDEIEKNKNTMLGKGLTFILDGALPEVLKKVMINYVYSSNCMGKDLLEKMIIAEGLVFLQMYSENSRFIADILISYIGEDLIEEAEKYLGISSSLLT